MAEHESLDSLFQKLSIKPRSITVRIERAVRQHPTYWEARVRETAKSPQVFDRVLYDENAKKGMVIFARLQSILEEQRVSNIVYHRVEFLTLNFSYELHPIIKQATITFHEPYEATSSPTLEIRKDEQPEEERLIDQLIREEEERQKRKEGIDL